MKQLLWIASGETSAADTSTAAKFDKKEHVELMNLLYRNVERQGQREEMHMAYAFRSSKKTNWKEEEIRELEAQIYDVVKNE